MASSTISGFTLLGSANHFLDFSFPVSLGEQNGGQVKVAFDTGFAESYITTCSTGVVARPADCYNSSASKTFAKLPPLAASPVFFNQDIKGSRGKDTLTIYSSSSSSPNISLAGAPFTLVSLNQAFSTSSTAGVVGLGFGSSFIATAMEKKLVSRPIYGFSVSDDNQHATLDVGFWNTSTNYIERIVNITTMQLKNSSVNQATVMPFGVVVQDVVLDNASLSQSLIRNSNQSDSNTAVIRTTKFISYFPKYVMEPIVKATNASRNTSSPSLGLYQVACEAISSLPTLTIQLKVSGSENNSFNATYKPEEYIFTRKSQDQNGKDYCFLGMVEDPGLFFSDFFLGLGLLRKYALFFDGERDSVGFGVYKSGLELATPTSISSPASSTLLSPPSSGYASGDGGSRIAIRSYVMIISINSLLLLLLL